MLNKFIKILYKLMSDFAICSYFPSNLFFGENKAKVSIFYKIFRNFKKYRQVPLLDKNGNRITFKKGIDFQKKKENYCC